MPTGPIGRLSFQFRPPISGRQRSSAVFFRGRAVILIGGVPIGHLAPLLRRGGRFGCYPDWSETMEWANRHGRDLGDEKRVHISHSPPKAVAIIAGSDTVSTAVGCVKSLLHSLPPWCDIILSYSAAPTCLTNRVRAAAGNRHVTIIESQKWLPQNELRNRALANLCPYDYYLLFEPDSRIEPGSLERCIETHNNTGADLVCGVVIYGPSIDFGREGKNFLHFAGGECRFRPDADGRPGFERVHPWVPRRLEELREETGDKPWDTELIEYHGLCLTRRAVELLTPLDIQLLSMEEVDLSLLATKQHLRMVIDPCFEIRYERAADYFCDILPYRKHWGGEAVQESVRYFAKKYGLPTDGELFRHQTQWNRQHYEDIGVVTRPVFRHLL